MTFKKFLKLLGIVTIGGAASQTICRAISKKMYVAEGRRADKALDRLMRANGWFKYVSDSGTIPIYTYDAKKIDLDKLNLPEGYILRKVIHPYGAVNYEIGADQVKKVFNTSYHPVYLYLEDASEWNEVFEEEESDSEEK